MGCAVAVATAFLGRGVNVKVARAARPRRVRTIGTVDVGVHVAKAFFTISVGVAVGFRGVGDRVGVHVGYGFVGFFTMVGVFVGV